MWENADQNNSKYKPFFTQYEISPDDDNFEIPGYNIIRNDHPSNTKREGVCLYN